MTDAIAGTRRAMKELVDGTIRLTVDISPVDRAQFWALFPSIDMPIALAPLVNDFEQKQGTSDTLKVIKQLVNPDDEKKGGALCKLAAILCNDPKFQDWVGDAFPDISIQIDDDIEGPEERAASYIRVVCDVSSRRKLDHDARAARIFNERIRLPFLAHQGLA